MTSWREFLIGLIGAVIGASISYFSDWLKERRRKHNDQHGAIVQTQLVLIAQLSTVQNIQRQHLAPFEKDPEREMKLASFPIEDTPLRVNYSQIAFLLTEANPNLVFEVHTAEDSYLSVVRGLDFRNEAVERLYQNSYPETFEPKTGHGQIHVNDPRYEQILKDRTNALYRDTASAIERLSGQIKRLKEVGERLYDIRSFLLKGLKIFGRIESSRGSSGAGCWAETNHLYAIRTIDRSHHVC